MLLSIAFLVPGLVLGPLPTLVAPAWPVPPRAAATIPPIPETDLVDGVALTRLTVYLGKDASVERLRLGLAAVDGEIVSADTGLPVLTVAVPRQRDLAGIRRVAEQVKLVPGVLWASPATTGSPEVLPPDPADVTVDHLLFAHFPAAFNARALAARSCADPVTVVVPDSYGLPIAAFFPDFGTQFHTDAAIGPPSAAIDGDHGYAVLSMLTAAFDGIHPTGANPMPECLDLIPVQIDHLSTADKIVAISAAVPADRKVIVSSAHSFGDNCGFDDVCTPATVGAIRAAERAMQGAFARSRFGPAADRVLVVSSAGNNADSSIATIYPGTAAAELNSAFNFASKGGPSSITDPRLWDPQIACTPPDPCYPSLAATPAELSALAGFVDSLGPSAQQTLRNNTLIAGSTDGLTVSSFSESGDDIRVTAERIADPVPPYGEAIQGTSLAAPQVAGLAAYLWLLSPELRALPVSVTIDAITQNAERQLPFLQLDAYASVLSLDEVGPATPETAPVRLALLDVDGDGDFDEADFRSYRDAYVDSGLVLDPETPDYGRHDINGDGFTGGTRRTGFDLVRATSSQFGLTILSEVSAEIDGRLQTFDEHVLTDADILCFYAHSPMFTGDTVVRDADGADVCGITPFGFPPLEVDQPVEFELTLPGATESVEWTVSEGELPSGLTLTNDGSTATIAGTPDTEEPYELTVTATSELGSGRSREYSGTVGFGCCVYFGTVTEVFRSSGLIDSSCVDDLCVLRRVNRVERYELEMLQRVGQPITLLPLASGVHLSWFVDDRTVDVNDGTDEENCTRRTIIEGGALLETADLVPGSLAMIGPVELPVQITRTAFGADCPDVPDVVEPPGTRTVSLDVEPLTEEVDGRLEALIWDDQIFVEHDGLSGMAVVDGRVAR